MDNFDAVDLSWVKHTTDPLEVLRHGLDFLQDSTKINDSNREVWCNLYVTPALEGICSGGVQLGRGYSLGPRKSNLGSASDPNGAQSCQLDCGILQ